MNRQRTVIELILAGILLALLATVLGVLGVGYVEYHDHSPVFVVMDDPVAMNTPVQGQDQLQVRWTYQKHRNCEGTVTIEADNAETDEHFFLYDVNVTWPQTESNEIGRIETVTKINHYKTQELGAGHYRLRVTLDYDCNIFDRPLPQILPEVPFTVIEANG